MEKTEMAEVPAVCDGQGPHGSLRALLRNRKLAVAATVAAIGGGLVFNWGWLVAAGLAPLVLSVLPCLVMCALGLCMNKLLGGRGACANTRTEGGKLEMTAGDAGYVEDRKGDAQ